MGASLSVCLTKGEAALHVNVSETVASLETIASRARLEALANLPFSGDTDSNPGVAIEDGCRIAYSSVLASETREEAQALLARIFTQALTQNPRAEIGVRYRVSIPGLVLLRTITCPAAPCSPSPGIESRHCRVCCFMMRRLAP